MNGLYVACGLIAAALLAYLVYAALYPEQF